MDKVSFIIPTLNRVRYVGRAVASCITAGEKTGVAFEVIVLDSQSDDGSWEMLTERFGHDSRVVLRQNRRGLGPTRSWLDGAEFVTGNVVTFIWSDDYVADTILDALLPAIRAGGDVAIGKAMIRDVGNDEPLPMRSGQTVMLDPVELAGAYYGITPGIVAAPVSPACALFSRRAFDRWRDLVIGNADTDLLVQQLMWRRAIGPDVLLFLVALSMQQGDVAFVASIVAQFSAHEDSISISSPEWLLRGGYLAARVLTLRQTRLFEGFPADVRHSMHLRSALQAAKLSRGIPEGVRGLEDKAAVSTICRGYARTLVTETASEAGWPRTVAMLARLAVTELRGRRSTSTAVSMAPV